MSSLAFLDAYEPLDVIGNGSFGIIRKVRRKADGLLFARKELNFERMSERDRKQIVAEVNILKDLHHDHIVRYHDRFVDRDAGILYILMEYCGGGDLSTVIKQAAKHNRPIPEDTIWHYFLQILHALHHCHHPNSHGRSSSGSGSFENEAGTRRVQILHRDLKPDNVFLDENNTVKLGDFGLSKALAQASFASTYVGTPYYMSPELMQEKAYDSKSDIWSLGCLIYELCALKPPFHEAKTHSELSIFIRNGRIPPLPRGYSQALTSVIKSMLNLNPAMRPSAAQLLQHERLELVNKVSETEKMLSIVKTHRATLSTKEREIMLREKALQDKEQHISALLNQKDQEVSTLQQFVAQLQQAQSQNQYSRQDLEAAVKQAVARREEELRVLVMKREEEVAVAIAKREEEIMEAVRAREAEVDQACLQREELIKKEVDERIQWVLARENELRAEEVKLQDAKAELEANMKKLEQTMATKGRKDKPPLEEVKNLLEPLTRVAQATPQQRRRTHKFEAGSAQPTPRPTSSHFPSSALETPVSRAPSVDYMPSAMKGVVLTATGEILATPSPAELVKLFNKSPKVGLNFGKIFDFEENDRKKGDNIDMHPSPPPSPSMRREMRKSANPERERDGDDTSEGSSSSSNVVTSGTSAAGLAPPPTRLRKPSIRASTRSRSAGTSSSNSNSEAVTSTASYTHNHAHTLNYTSSTQVKPLPHPHLRPSTSSSNLSGASRASSIAANINILPIPVPRSYPSPEYDFNDEENLPSPFIKRIDKSASVKAAASYNIALSSASSGCGTSAASSSSSSSSASSTSTSGSSTSTTHSITSSSASSTATATAKPKRRESSGLLLRAVAAANSAGRIGRSALSPNADDEFLIPSPNNDGASMENSRPSLASARKATEEARKALMRS